jgi:hypothetical protein
VWVLNAPAKRPDDGTSSLSGAVASASQWVAAKKVPTRQESALPPKNARRRGRGRKYLRGLLVLGWG